LENSHFQSESDFFISKFLIRKFEIRCSTKSDWKWPIMTTTELSDEQQGKFQTERVTPSSGGSPPKNGRGGNFRDGRLLNQLFSVSSERGDGVDELCAESGCKFSLTIGLPQPAAGQIGQLLSTGARHQGQKPQRDSSIVVEPLLLETSTLLPFHSSEGGICRVPKSDAADAWDTTGAAF
jgi:hypothetical protein